MTNTKLASSRNAIVKVLETKLGPKSSANFENQIYNMCLRLASKSGGVVEEVYVKYAYEKVGCLMDAKDRKGRACVLADIKGDLMEWDSSSYDDFRSRQNIDNAQIAQGIKVEKGEFPCRNKDCKSRECYMYQMQDRSGDEGATTYVQCTKCRTRYRFN